MVGIWADSGVGVMGTVPEPVGGCSSPVPCGEAALGGGCRGAALVEGGGEGLGDSEGFGVLGGTLASCRLAAALLGSPVPTASP